MESFQFLFQASAVPLKLLRRILITLASFQCKATAQEMRTKLDEKMMHNVRTAVKEADALLVILDATEDAAAALAMVNLGPDWRGPPVALVSGLLLQLIA